MRAKAHAEVCAWTALSPALISEVGRVPRRLEFFLGPAVLKGNEPRNEVWGVSGASKRHLLNSKLHDMLRFRVF